MNHVAPITEAPAADTLKDGVYFGLDETVYHSIPRLSSSGIKNLLVSPMDFWARSWLNPRRKEDDDDADWKVYGRAYHKRILEGREAFYAAYYGEVDPLEHPGVLTKQDQFKAACRDRGLAVGGTNADLVGRLIADGFDRPLMPDLMAKNDAANAGKIKLKADWMFDIALSAKCIELDEALAPRFTGGFPEVAVLWTEEIATRDGEVFKIPMKLKADYLKPREINDLKTLANQMQKPFDRAVYQDIAARKYHIQVATYYRGVDAAQDLVERGQVHVVSGPAPTHKWMDAFAKHPKTFCFIFQQKGIAPIAGGFSMDDSRLLQMLGAGRAQIREAQLEFIACMDHFGSDPWIKSRGIRVADDTDFPAYMVQ